MTDFIKSLTIRGTEWGIMGAQVVMADKETGAEKPARKLSSEDFPSILDASVSATVTKNEELTAEIERLNQTAASHATVIAAKDGEISELKSAIAQITVQQDQSQAEPLEQGITRRQLRMALLGVGITSKMVEGAIAVIEDDMQREAAMIEWQDATIYHRDHPLLNNVATALSITDEQIDTMWVAAIDL